MSQNPVPIRLRVPHHSQEEFFGEFEPYWRQGVLFLATKTPILVDPKNACSMNRRVVFEFVLSTGICALSGEGTIVGFSGADTPKPGITLHLAKIDQKSEERMAQKKAVEKEEFAVSERQKRWQAIMDRPVMGADKNSQPTVGIELGIGVLRAAFCSDSRVRSITLEDEKNALPTCVAWNQQGELLIGTRAEKQALVDSRSVIWALKLLLGRNARSPMIRGLVGGIPCEMNEDENGELTFLVPGKEQSATQIASYLLAEVRKKASQNWGANIDKAVVAVPSFFCTRQREAIQLACQLAGWEVERMVSEPVAAAIALEFGKGLVRKRVLVFYLEGGVLDISLLAITGNEFEVMATGGGMVGTVEPVSTGFIEKSLQLCQKVFDRYQIVSSAIDDVLLLGDTRHTNLMREWLEPFLGKPVQQEDARGYISAGAALLGGALSDQDKEDADLFCLHCSELLSAPVGIISSNGYEKVLDVPSRLPCEKTRVFSSDENGNVSFFMVQGESDRLDENECLGEIKLEELIPGGEAEITFTMTRDGILRIVACSQGKSWKVCWNRASLWEGKSDAVPSNQFSRDSQVQIDSESLPDSLAGEEKGILRGFRRFFGRKPRFV